MKWKLPSTISKEAGAMDRDPCARLYKLLSWKLLLFLLLHRRFLIASRREGGGEGQIPYREEKTKVES